MNKPRRPPLAVQCAAQTVIDYWTNREKTRRARLTSPADVRNLVLSQQILSEYQTGTGVESVSVLLLDSTNRLLGAEILSTGTANQAPVYPRNVAKLALQDDATAIILIHNHPGGNPTPSADDLQLTRELKAALEKLDVQLHDHLIIADGRVWSIAAGREI